MTLESIMAKVDRCNDLVLAESVHESLTKIESPVFYVAPKYNEIHNASDAKFILFSAPGASGKSTLAKYIAHKYGGLYWNLARITLGENSFHGTLWRAMQQDQLLNYFQALNEGKAILILDAFDEAEMISGRAGIEYLLKDLNAVTQESIMPTVYLFARTESALFISEFCEKNSISYSHYEIGFFEEYNAKNFIEEKLRRSGKAITPIVKSCIDEQFRVIRRLLGKDELANSFIGYAPVLEALAESLDEEKNTIKLLENIKGSISSTNIIFKILEFLLEREHKKVCDGLKEKWKRTYPDFDDWNEVYTVKEQLVRIVEYILWGKSDEDSFFENCIIPDDMYVDYIESLKVFLPQHPFLQNLTNESGPEFTGPAFRDYALAAVLANADFEDLALEYFADKSIVSHFPSQLLFDFYCVFSEEKMTGKIFPLLYDSFKAKETSCKSAIIDISGMGEDKFVTFRLNDYTNKETENSEMQVIGDGTFYVSRLANANIDIDGDIYIGDMKSTTRLYNSSIIANRIIFCTGDIRIEASKPGHCLLVSRQDAINKYGEMPKFEVRSDPRDLIKISIPNINSYYRLRTYSYEYEEKSNDDYIRFNLFIKKIMNCLRKHRKDVPAKDREFIDNEIISKSKIKRQYMEFLIKKSIIYIDKEQPYLYKLDVERLGEYGLNWVALNQDEESGLMKLYTEYKKYRTD